MNYQQAYDLARINGEEIVPTVCRMCGPGGPGGGCGCVNDTMVKCDLCPGLLKNGVAPPCAETCPGDALTLISISSSEKLLHEEQIIRLLSMLVSS